MTTVLFAQPLSEKPIQNSWKPKPISGKEYSFQPQEEEGYFQGWNINILDPNHKIFLTYLVSNQGPNSLNNGVSLIIVNKAGTIFRTSEWGEKDLKTSTDHLEQKSGYQNLEEVNGNLFLYAHFEDIHLELEIKRNQDAFSLTNGRVGLEKKNRFLRSDIFLPSGRAQGTLKIKNETFTISGKAFGEHLLLNYDVYKFSRRWEIGRGWNPKGDKIFLGGYLALENSSPKFFKTIALQKKGELTPTIFATTEVETIEEETSSFSEYVYPKKEIWKMESGKPEETTECQVEIQNGMVYAEVNILSQISSILRFFIQVFFAKPFQMQRTSTYLWSCHGNTIEFPIGVHSYFLINP